ncbi:hypothetical protein D3C87_1676560 [compost metagenome]
MQHSNIAASRLHVDHVQDFIPGTVGTNFQTWQVQNLGNMTHVFGQGGGDLAHSLSGAVIDIAFAVVSVVYSTD